MTNKKQKLMYLMDAVFFAVTADELLYLICIIEVVFGGSFPFLMQILQFNEFVIKFITIQEHENISFIVLNLLLLTMDILYIKLRKKAKPYESLPKLYKKAIIFCCITGTIMSVFFTLLPIIGSM